VHSSPSKLYQVPFVLASFTRSTRVLGRQPRWVTRWKRGTSGQPVTSSSAGWLQAASMYTWKRGGNDSRTRGMQ
jgi:hypothetical protein